MKVHKITVVIFVCTIGLTAVRIETMMELEKEAQLNTLKEQEKNMLSLKAAQKDLTEQAAAKTKDLNAIWGKTGQLTRNEEEKGQALKKERADLLAKQKAKFEEQAKLHAEQKKALNNAAKDKVLPPEALKARREALLAQEKELHAKGVEIGARWPLWTKITLGAILLGGGGIGVDEFFQHVIFPARAAHEEQTVLNSIGDLMEAKASNFALDYALQSQTTDVLTRDTYNGSANTAFTGKTLLEIGAFLAAGGDPVYQDINNQIKCAVAPKTVDAAICNCLQGFILPSLQSSLAVDATLLQCKVNCKDSAAITESQQVQTQSDKVAAVSATVAGGALEVAGGMSAMGGSGGSIAAGVAIAAAAIAGAATLAGGVAHIAHAAEADECERKAKCQSIHDAAIAAIMVTPNGAARSNNCSASGGQSATTAATITKPAGN